MAQSSVPNVAAALGPRIMRLWLVALVGRIAYALIAPGFHARDDYFHVLEPALRWIDDPGWIWALSTTPGAGIRSHLLPKVVQALVEIGSDFTPGVQLRFVGAVLAFWSSLIIPLSWPLIERLAPSEPRRQIELGLLLALHPALIYGAPKLLIEVQCLPLLMASLSILVSSRAHLQTLAAGVLFGLGVYVRYQAITIAPFALVALMKTKKPRWSKLLTVIAGAIVGLSLGGVYDLATDGRFLGPLLQNIGVNLEPSTELTRSSPLSYLGIVLALACPWTVLKVRWRALNSSPVMWALIAGIGSFILVHSLTPHKEERFLYPILPMLLLVFGILWQTISTQHRHLRLSVIYFHIGLTAVLFSVHPQQATRRALEGVIETQSQAVLSLGPEVQSFYLRPQTLPVIRNRKFTNQWLAEALKVSPARAFFVISYAPQSESVVATLENNQLTCEAPQTYTQNWADNLAFQLNPRHNIRRSPIETRLCRR